MPSVISCKACNKNCRRDAHTRHLLIILQKVPPKTFIILQKLSPFCRKFHQKFHYFAKTFIISQSPHHFARNSPFCNKFHRKLPPFCKSFQHFAKHFIILKNETKKSKIQFSPNQKFIGYSCHQDLLERLRPIIEIIMEIKHARMQSACMQTACMHGKMKHPTCMQR